MGLAGVVDAELSQVSPSAKYLRQRASSATDRDAGLYSVGRQEYIGICLPFDIRQLFQVSCASALATEALLQSSIV